MMMMMMTEIIYTVSHKKRASLFCTISAIFGGFLHLLYQWKRNEYSTEELQNLQLDLTVTVLSDKTKTT